MKYKLIKKYPSSPEINTESSNTKTNFVFENYPEFWEKVVELDYKILSFKNPDNRKIYSKNKEYFEPDDGSIAQRKYSYCLSFYEINSVMRLSDEKVFIVGQKLFKTSFTEGSRHIENKEFPYDDIITKIGIIKNHDFEIAGFKDIQDGKLMFSANNRYGNYNVSLENAKHCKEILFKTEDGVDIYEGNKFTTINKNLNIKTLQSFTGGYISIPDNKHIGFSTKEKAEEYILMNKPCLSLNDVFNIFKGNAGSIVKKKNYLEILVKSKLK
jgi:hypothetical protein